LRDFKISLVFTGKSLEACPIRKVAHGGRRCNSATRKEKGPRRERRSSWLPPLGAAAGEDPACDS
jgi:hypothetical protein